MFEWSTSSILIDIPITVLTAILPYHSLLELAKLHHVRLDHTRRLEDVVSYLRTHCCNPFCGALYCVIVCECGEQSISPSPQAQSRPSSGVCSQKIDLSETVRGRARFPPEPPRVADFARFVSDWCEYTSFAAISEGACVVCGELVVHSMLTSVDRKDIDLSPLVWTGCRVACQERVDVSSIGLESDDPVLYSEYRDTQVLQVCDCCLHRLLKHRMPSHSLANGLWLGDVPVVLQRLRFVEKLLIACYWHNFFVVQVDKGQRKLCANAVAFPQPVARMHNVLPPLREEFEECLAVLFVGLSVPTIDDVKRTPLLVRHGVVLDALHWLCLNHSDYTDVQISCSNLMSYSEDGPPMCVLHRSIDGGVPGEAMSSYEMDEECGMENGVCPFVVHGLSGAELINM
ncbi:hypothetical protein BKA93DRAFT_722840, partial [Sparassis latifolia]